jgi:hypothetical protein
MCAQRVGADEALLAAGDCQEILAGVNYVGHIELTTKRVRFEPTSLMRMAGGEAWEIALEDIQSSVLTPSDRRVVLTSALGARVLRGVGARALHEVLLPLIGAEGPVSAEGRERVLVATEAEIEVNDLVSARGELVLSSRKLQFQPARLERALWPRLAVDIPVESIEGCAVVGMRRRLEVRTAGRTMRFVGSVIPALFGALHALAEQSQGEGEAPEFEVTPVSLVRGPVMHPGALVRTRKRLAFLGTGTLDALIGLSGVTELPLDELSELSVTGLIDKRIEVATAADRLVFSCSKAEEMAGELVSWWARNLPGPVSVPEGEAQAPAQLEVDGEPEEAPPPPASSPTPTEEVRASIEQILADWRSEFPMPGTISLFAPALRVEDGAPTVPGWLMVGEETLVWLPRFGERHPVRIALGGTVALRRDAPPGAVHLQVGGGRMFRWLVPVDNFRAALTEEVEDPAVRPLPSLRPPPPDALYRGGNRRQTFRVPVRPVDDHHLSFWLVERGELRQSIGELVDLSLHGFALKLQTPLNGPTSVRVIISRGEEDMHSLEATLVHQRKIKDEDGWLTGWRFEGSWGDVEARTRSVWMDLQQRTVRRGQEGEDAAV